MVQNVPLYQVRTEAAVAGPAGSPGVDVSRLDGVEEQLGHAHALHVDEVRLEEGLGRLEALAAHLDHTAVWQLQTRGREDRHERKERKEKKRGGAILTEFQQKKKKALGTLQLCKCKKLASVISIQWYRNLEDSNQLDVSIKMYCDTLTKPSLAFVTVTTSAWVWG